MSVITGRRTPTLHVGAGITADVLRRVSGGRRVLAVIDARIGTWIASRMPDMESIAVDAQAADLGVMVRVTESLRASSPEIVVAVGGGTVLDTAKLAVLSAWTPGALEFLRERTESSALTRLPMGLSRRRPLIAVPTTVGTSSETNAVAILTNAQGHRLIAGAALYPDHAVLDAAHLRSLPMPLLREGCLEAFLRVAGARSRSLGSPRARAHAVAIGRALIAAGDAVGTSRTQPLRIARLSAATQRSAALRGSDPYAARHWYVANEVSSVLGVRKMTATATIVPSVWRRVCDGDTRWGDAQSLTRFWGDVARGTGLPLSPPAGIDALADRWGIVRASRPAAAVCEHIARALEQRWGGKLPVLRSLIVPDFVDVLDTAHWAPPATTGIRPTGPLAAVGLRSSRRGGGEGNGHHHAYDGARV